MARSVNEEEFASRRNEILDVAQQLIYTVGYQTMTIQDILDRMQISKGAFYHYFHAKQDLLEAMLDRISAMMVTQLEPMINDSSLPSVEKLNRFYQMAGQWKTERRDLLIAIIRGWYDDNNALVREKLRRKTLQLVTPILVKIICQGVAEGTMNTAHPEKVAGVLLTVVYGVGDATAELALATADGQTGNLTQARELIHIYQDAVERILGMAPGSVEIMNEYVLKAWFD